MREEDVGIVNETMIGHGEVRPTEGVLVRHALRVLGEVVAHLLPVERVEAARRAVVDGQTLGRFLDGLVPGGDDREVHGNVDGHDVENVVRVALHRAKVAAADGDEQLARPVGLLHPAGIRFFPRRADDRHANDGQGWKMGLFVGQDRFG